MCWGFVCLDLLMGILTYCTLCTIKDVLGPTFLLCGALYVGHGTLAAHIRTNFLVVVGVLTRAA
jgi:hypothetical protein